MITINSISVNNYKVTEEIWLEGPCTLRHHVFEFFKPSLLSAIVSKLSTLSF